MAADKLRWNGRDVDVVKTQNSPTLGGQLEEVLHLVGLGEAERVEGGHIEVTGQPLVGVLAVPVSDGPSEVPNGTPRRFDRGEQRRVLLCDLLGQREEGVFGKRSRRSRTNAHEGDKDGGSCKGLVEHGAKGEVPSDRRDNENFVQCDPRSRTSKAMSRESRTTKTKRTRPTTRQ